MAKKAARKATVKSAPVIVPEVVEFVNADSAYLERTKRWVENAEKALPSEPLAGNVVGTLTPEAEAAQEVEEARTQEDRAAEAAEKAAAVKKRETEQDKAAILCGDAKAAIAKAALLMEIAKEAEAKLR